jgi:PEP-CTERM motif
VRRSRKSDRHTLDLEKPSATIYSCLENFLKGTDGAIVMKSQYLIATALAAVLAWGSAQAAPVTFFGEDPNPTGSTPIAHPVSDATQATFLSNLTGVGVEDFDSFANGTTTIAANFGAAGTATLTGGAIQNFSSAGRFAISSPNYYNTDTTSFSINFSNPVAAFGFYGTDIGDFGGQLSLLLTDTMGNTTSLIVPATEGSGGEQPENGSVLYFGFYDLSTTYTSIAFQNSNTADQFGFDNFTIGSIQQVTPSAPEPATWAMMLLGFAGLGFVGYRRGAGKRAMV